MTFSEDSYGGPCGRSAIHDLNFALPRLSLQEGATRSAVDKMTPDQRHDVWKCLEKNIFTADIGSGSNERPRGQTVHFVLASVGLELSWAKLTGFRIR